MHVFSEVSSHLTEEVRSIAVSDLGIRSNPCYRHIATSPVVLLAFHSTFDHGPREAGQSAPSDVPDRSATGRPESARLPGVRLGPPPQLPTRPLWRQRPRPPLRGHQEYT